MAGRNGSKTDGVGTSGVGTVEPFSLPDRQSDGDDNGNNIAGVPIESAEPERLTGTRNADGTARRKPGRRPGWNRTGESAGETKKDRQGLPTLEVTAGALKGVHELASFLLKIEELELEDAEAEKLAGALLALAKYYPGIDVPGKYIAWMNLLTTMGIVYSPKVATCKLRKANERKAKLANRPVVVQQFSQTAQ